MGWVMTSLPEHGVPSCDDPFLTDQRGTGQLWGWAGLGLREIKARGVILASNHTGGAGTGKERLGVRGLPGQHDSHHQVRP